MRRRKLEGRRGALVRGKSGYGLPGPGAGGPGVSSACRRRPRTRRAGRDQLGAGASRRVCRTVARCAAEPGHRGGDRLPRAPRTGRPAAIQPPPRDLGGRPRPGRRRTRRLHPHRLRRLQRRRADASRRGLGRDDGRGDVRRRIERGRCRPPTDHRRGRAGPWPPQRSDGPVPEAGGRRLRLAPGLRRDLRHRPLLRPRRRGISSPPPPDRAPPPAPPGRRRCGSWLPERPSGRPESSGRRRLRRGCRSSNGPGDAERNGR